MRQFSHYLAKELNLSADEEDIIAYGLFVFLFNGSSILLLLCFGLLFHCFSQTILFLGCFTGFLESV